MSGGPITINYSANISDAVAGTDDLGKAMDKVGDAADDSAKQSGKAADQTLAAQKKAAQGIISETRQASEQQIAIWARTAVAQGRDAAEVQQTYGILYDKIEADAQRASQAVATSTNDGFTKAGGTLETFKQNASLVLGTAFQSFDGSVASIGTAISGLGALIPGVGGLIGAALGGVATGMFNSWDAESKASAKAVADMYDDMITSGNDYVSKDLVNKNIQDTIGDTKKFNEVKAESKAIGVDLSTVLRANAGDQLALNTVINASSDAYNIASDKVDALAGKNTRLPPTLVAQREAAAEARDKYLGLANAQDTAAAKADAYRQAATQAGTDSSTAAGGVDTLHRSLDSLPSTKNIKFGVDTSAYDRAVATISGKTIHINVAFTPLAGNRVY